MSSENQSAYKDVDAKNSACVISDESEGYDWKSFMLYSRKNFVYIMLIF